MSKCICPSKECEIHGTPTSTPKPLAQYLDEYIQHEATLEHLDILHGGGSWQEFMEQALEAYQSTENVTIKIERNV